MLVKASFMNQCKRIPEEGSFSGIKENNDIMNAKSFERRLNINFASIQGFYWMVFCSSNSFASVFLLSKDFNNSQIGIVLALANIFAVVLQPIVAAYADKSTRITLKQIAVALTFGATALAAVVIFMPAVFFLLAILFILILTLVFVLQPLINGLNFEFVNQGFTLNFGVTRSVGSVTYAILSFALGILIERSGPGVIPWVTLILAVGLCFSLVVVKDSRRILKDQITKNIALDETYESRSLNSKEQIVHSEKNGFTKFLNTYRKFFGYLAGVFFIFIYHTMFNNYMVHVVNRVGGTSSQLGKTIFIAAMLELPVMGFFALLLKKFGIRKLLCCSGVFFAVKAFVALISVNMAMLYIDQVFQMLSYAILIPASVYYVNLMMEEKDRVKGQAITTGAMTAGGVVGNLSGGVILDRLGVVPMLTTCVAVSVVGMILILIFAQEKK